MPPIIEAHGLRKRYAGFAPVLRGVDISVEPGEMVAIMGPSGCGKSTMLHVLGLLHAPDEGTLTIMGQEVLRFSRAQTAAFRRENLGFVMQQSNLFDHSTVFENVEFPMIYGQVPPEERWPRVIRALELVRLTSRVHYPSNRLSGGEQQRVAIARAMVNNPRILMADEPTGALDARTSRLIMENFRSLCHSGGVAMVMVTHDPKMAEYCDTIYTLEEGLLVTQRHTVPHINAEEARRHAQILDGPTMRLSTALVADDFLESNGEATRAEAHLLHNEGLLSHVATLEAGSLLGHEMESYSLPMPVKNLGGRHCFAARLGLSGKSSSALSSAKGGVSALLGGSELAEAKVLASWTEEEHIRCLYAVGGRRAPAVAWAASRIAGLPFAFAVRETDGWQSASASVQAAFAVLAGDASFIRCASEPLRQALLPLLPEQVRPRLTTVPDPLALTPAEEDSQPSEEISHELHLLCAGSLFARKGYDVLLKACAGLKKRGIVFSLAVAGDGPEMKNLKKLASTLNIADEVTFHGQVPHENMGGLYADCDIFVAPGINYKGDMEGIPTALAEAMAFGCCVAASDLDAQAWLLDRGAYGVVTAQGNAEALADALAALAGSAAERGRLGSAAQKRINEFQTEVCRQLKALFAPLVPSQDALKL